MPEYFWSQLLGRDDIRPIYEPEFVPANEAGYADDELVMGVAIAGEAKAYPVGLLNYREMVNDELAGIPVRLWRNSAASPGDRYATPVSCTTGG